MSRDALEPVRPNPYTDLAVEATAAARGEGGQDTPGVRVHEERHGEVTISRVEVYNAQGEHLIGKVKGHYITLDCPGLRRRNRDLQDQVAKLLVAEIARLARLGKNDEVLVVGLGNWNATPDALGPRVVSKLLVTRHLKEYVPAELKGNLRAVAAVAPGVLGLTGIETGEIIRGIVDRIRPQLVICIDALAARSVERIGTTIQLANTGIYPGSGVGNSRPAINQDTLGVPVVALGVPTVVHAATIAGDTVDMLARTLRGKSRFFDLLAEFSPAEKQRLIHEVLGAKVGDLVVTPKEIDDLIEDMAQVVAGALNAVLHPGIDTEDLKRYLT
jgi:spore protease